MDFQGRELLQRWLADSEGDEHNDGDPDTMRLVYETRIFLGVDVEDARRGLVELES